MKIWCVEDDVNIRNLELYTLKSTGFSPRGFADGCSFLKAVETERPDLVILDIMLPDIDGTEILKNLRSTTATKNLPVIMATAKGMEYDKIQSLDMGADDYLVKPFGMLEMVSRIKAVLRRSSHGDTDAEITIGGLKLNKNEYKVTAEGIKIALTHKEYEILLLFMSHPGTVYTREQLFDIVWGLDFYGETRTVDMHIRTLRRKLGRYGRMIETVRGVGYRMEAET